jgi:hypothetical protein
MTATKKPNDERNTMSGNIIDIIERSQARHALREERALSDLHAGIADAVAPFGPNRHGRTNSDWDISFWFAVLSPVFGILAGFLAAFLIYD